MSPESFQAYVEVVKRLRKDCPWDREQTPESLRESFLEEAYETIEAINNKNWDELKKELGDILLHVVMESIIAEETARFSLEDVITSSAEKLIRRHPHVFGDATADDAAHVKANWEKLKLKEGKESVLEGVPKELPALLRAHRLQDKASKVGFDWKHRHEVWAKVEEEIAELKEAVDEESEVEIEEELGDLLFALTNFSRFLQVNPEFALQRANEKFLRRFQFIEQNLRREGKLPEHVSLEEMDALWTQSKTAL
jgi:XTP/dITP diphosphohydrolase